MSNERTDSGADERAENGTMGPDWRGIALGAGDDTARAIATLVEATTDSRSTPSVSVDTLFETLADPGQRYVLSYLLQSEGAVACNELVDHVLAQVDHTMTDAEFRRRVASELTHTQLPKLAEAGLVEYNVERQIVGTTDLTPVARPYLGLALAHGRTADADG